MPHEREIQMTQSSFYAKGRSRLFILTESGSPGAIRKQMCKGRIYRRRVYIHICIYFYVKRDMSNEWCTRQPYKYEYICIRFHF